MTCAWNLAFSHSAHATPRHPPPPKRTSSGMCQKKVRWWGQMLLLLFFFSSSSCSALTAWNPPSSSISSPRNLLRPFLFSPTALSRRVHQCREVSRACVARTGPSRPWTGETKGVRKVEIITKTWGKYNTFWYQIGIKQHIGLIARFRWFSLLNRISFMINKKRLWIKMGSCHYNLPSLSRIRGCV